MLPYQLEIRTLVIERCRKPAVLGVAIHAAGAQSPFVGVLLVMARVTILERHREIAKPARIKMTLVAGQPHVLSFELERKVVVIEMRTKTIDAIMTIEARAAICQGMRRRESHVHLTMAGIAILQLKCGNIVRMTISAGERQARSRQLVTV